MPYQGETITGTSASNTAAVTITLPIGVSKYMICVETTGTVAAGTLALTFVPLGRTTAQSIDGTISLTAPKPYTIDGLQAKSLIFTPISLSAGCTFTAVVQPMVE